jgi:hypothetical protein
MQTIDLLVADQHLCLRGRVTTELAAAAIASLSADPFTWDELKHAMGRFVDWSGQADQLGLTVTPHSAVEPTCADSDPPPDCVIDLAARMLLTRWDQSADPLPVNWGGAAADPSSPLTYSLHPDWLIGSDVIGWRQTAWQRRQERLGSEEADPRTTLYGSAMLTFLIQRCQASSPSAPTVADAADPATSGAPASGAPASGDTAADESLDNFKELRRIGDEWLRTRPDPLQGASVWEVLERDRRHISSDMSTREAQWSRTGKPPVGLRETDTAYRRAGIGPHECYLYFDLLAHLIEVYLWRWRQTSSDVAGLAIEVEWLRQRRDAWLWQEDPESMMGKPPREIIDLERRRIPLVVEAHDVLHDDCPLCQMMMSEESGPVFCRLDGFGGPWDTEDEFDDQWLDDEDEDEDEDEDDNDDDDQEHDDSFNDGSRQGRGPGGAGAPSGLNDDRPTNRTDPPISPPVRSVWNRVVLIDVGQTTPEIDLFAVAACCGELIEDLKERSAERVWIEVLNRHVGNLATTLRGSEPSLLSPVVTRFCECLEDLGNIHGDLLEKVEDLQSRLMGLIALTDDSE